MWSQCALVQGYVVSAISSTGSAQPYPRAFLTRIVKYLITHHLVPYLSDPVSSFRYSIRLPNQDSVPSKFDCSTTTRSATSDLSEAWN